MPGGEVRPTSEEVQALQAEERDFLTIGAISPTPGAIWRLVSPSRRLPSELCG
jgi:hypothetical protein